MNDPARRYNILFVTPAFVFGGLERVILDRVRELDRSRFNPMLCSLYPPVPGMARLFRRRRVDLVNARDIVATFYAALAARLAGIRRVVHSDHSQILGLRRLVIVGEGPLKPELEAEADRLGMGGRVIFTGVREDIRDLMGLFDLFALPSLWEGQPLVLIEALAGALRRLLEDEAGRRQMAERAKAHALAHLTHTEMARRYQSLFSSLLDPGLRHRT